VYCHIGVHIHNTSTTRCGTTTKKVRDDDSLSND
jgi:hypothetical protein